MLEMKNISKVVGGETHIHPTDLALERGSLNVLLGPTLSGKTSLMRLMAGLDKPASGSIHFDGADVTGLPVQSRSVAMVYQQFINYPAMTVYDNIASPMRIMGADNATVDREVRKAAELLKLSPYLDRTPLNLSGGQQQRTALARALANRPRMLLMDEPFGALDHQTRELMQDLLLGIWEAERTTVLFVTHDIDEAVFMGSRVMVMSARPGRIKLDRTVPLAHPRHYSVKTTAPFAELKAELTEAVRVEVIAAQAMA